MSNMIPRRTIDALRICRDVSLNNYGIDCDIYVPNNVIIIEDHDIYGKQEDYTFDHYIGKIWIEWSPNIHRLRGLGIYTEDQLPILAKMPRKMRADDLVVREVDVIRRSYIKINLEFVPDNTEKAEEFEIVDILNGPMHDATISKTHVLAPRRKTI